MERSITFSTKAEALAIPPPKTKTHIEHWHSTDSCFGMRIMRPRAKDGKIARRWLARYYEGGKDFRINLGSVDRVGWEQARVEALNKRLDAHSRRERGIVTPMLEEAYRAYRARREKSWAPDTGLDYEKKFELLPAQLTRMRIDQITDDDLRKAIASITKRISDGDPKTKGKRRRKRSKQQTGESSAISAMRLVKTIFSLHKYLKVDPFEQLLGDGFFRRREPRSSMVTSAQLPAFWSWLNTKAHPAVRDLLLCTMCMALRASVAGSLRWSNLIEDGGNFAYQMLPDQRGNKTRKLVPVPVPHLIVERVILPRRQSPTANKTWIIESPKHPGKPLRSIRGSLLALKKDTGISISLHDLRRTITSAVVRTSDLTTARRVLTHSLGTYEGRNATSGGYFVGEYEDMLRAMNRAVRYIRLLAEPKIIRQRNEAVPELSPEEAETISAMVDRAADEELVADILQVDAYDE